MGPRRKKQPRIEVIRSWTDPVKVDGKTVVRRVEIVFDYQPAWN